MEFTIGDWVTIVVAGSVIVAVGETLSRLLLGLLAQVQYNRRVKQQLENTDLASEVTRMFEQAFVKRAEDGDDER